MARCSVIANIFAVCLIRSIACQNTFPYNPCPDIFSYERNGTKWQGSLLVSDPPSYGSIIVLKLTLAVDERLQGNNYGNVELAETIERVGLLIKQRQPYRYRVVFPASYELPRIVSILLDNTEICKGPSSTEISTITLDHKLTTGIPVRSNGSPPSSSIVPQNQDSRCGKPSTIVQPLIFDGDETKRGEWPWLVAILRKQGVNTAFTCAGSLISPTVVVTAAHCMYSSTTGKLVQESDMILRFGAYNLDSEFEENVQSRTVRSFRVKEDFDRTTFLNDISIIILNSPVTINDYVRPICIWTGNDDQSLVVGSTGTVVGWGQNERGVVLTNGTRSVPANIVSTITCRGTKDSFHTSTSDKTLCAGQMDGRGPCKGDSGGGLYIKRGDRWVIRGIVSNAIYKEVVQCDLYNYVVYTDMAKFDSWIKISL